METIEISTDKLTRELVASIEAGRVVSRPFYHLEFDRVFPDEIYAQMVKCFPSGANYRDLPGRNNANINHQGVSTRVKIDLFPEYVRHLSPPLRSLWDQVGRALCSAEVQAAFVRKLAPVLEQRFGPNFQQTGLYPIPILTRDIAGYRISEHTDTHWKGITVQLYLPADESTAHIGTVFSERLPDGSFKRAMQMKFAPNTGYAFAVGSDTWHSVDPVGPEVQVRDSILLTYFVDQGPLRFFRNRGRRIGNFFLNEIRHLRSPPQ